MYKSLSFSSFRQAHFRLNAIFYCILIVFYDLFHYYHIQGQAIDFSWLPNNVYNIFSCIVFFFNLDIAISHFFVKYKFVIVEKIENKKIFHFINVVLLLFTHVYSITQYFVLIINLCSFFTFVLNIDLCPICYQIFSN